MNSVLEKQWFDIVVKAFKEEDAALRTLFSGYKKYHHGIWQLYETTYVYIALKELLNPNNNFPYISIWEEKYPSNSGIHADMILMEEDDPKDLIEFKIWKDFKEENTFAEIAKDIAKLSGEKKQCDKYILVIKEGDSRDIVIQNAQYIQKLENKFPTLINKCVCQDGFETSSYDTSQQTHILKYTSVLFFKIN